MMKIDDIRVHEGGVITPSSSRRQPAFRSGDPAAAQNTFALVEDASLTGGYAELGFVQDDLGPAVRRRECRGSRRRLGGAEFDVDFGAGGVGGVAGAEPVDLPDQNTVAGEG